MNRRLGPFKIGNAQAWLTASYIADTALVVLTIEGHGSHLIEGISAEEIVAFGSYCKLAGDEAESLKRKAARHQRFASPTNLKASPI